MTCVRFTGYDLSPPNAPGTPLFDAGKDTHFCPTPGTCRPFFQKNGPPPRATGSSARRQTRNFAYLCKPHKILCMPDFLDDLNDSQRAAVTYCDGPSLVIAGAGSGKTRVLTYKIAYLLEQGMAPWNILALTFTNKAAREMKERIARLVGPKRAQMLWMGTFHSVFARILRRESAAVGFSPRFTIYDQNDSRNLVKTLAKEMQLDEKLYKPALIAGRISAAKNRLLTAAQYGADGSIARRDEMDGVPATAELYARYEVQQETYTKKLQIEARVLGDLIVNHVIPTAVKFQNTLLDNCRGLTDLFGRDRMAAMCPSQLIVIEKISGYVESLRVYVHDMIEARRKANSIQDITERAEAYSSEVLPYMGRIREVADKLEMLVDDDLWPLPKYREMLLSR